jgi:catechol 2,3-dioxygenase-like lactoylglutathione lyase family enzyme
MTDRAATERGFAVRGLGEIALRTRNMAAMQRFYGEVIGLQTLADRVGITFFRIANGVAGHTAVLALFDAETLGETGGETGGPPAAGGGSSLHHLALSLPWAEQDAAIAWLNAQGFPARVEHFDWIGWRGVFTADPDGNTVELVAARPPEPNEAK